MPVKIIQDDERLTFEYMGGNFYYRRLPIKMKRKMTVQRTDARGVPDTYGIIIDATPYCLLGWDDKAVIGGDDKPLQFSLDVALKMPEEFFLAFARHLGISDPDRDETDGALKNSKRT